VLLAGLQDKSAEHLRYLLDIYDSKIAISAQIQELFTVVDSSGQSDIQTVADFLRRVTNNKYVRDGTWELADDLGEDELIDIALVRAKSLIVAKRDSEQKLIILTILSLAFHR
jgi:hypothetical protein